MTDSPGQVSLLRSVETGDLSVPKDRIWLSSDQLPVQLLHHLIIIILMPNGVKCQSAKTDYYYYYWLIIRRLSFQSKADHPQTAYTDTLFAPVNLALTR